MKAQLSTANDFVRHFAVVGRVRPSTTVQAAVAVVAGGPPQGAFVWHYLHITGWLRASRRRERAV